MRSHSTGGKGCPSPSSNTECSHGLRDTPLVSAEGGTLFPDQLPLTTAPTMSTESARQPYPDSATWKTKSVSPSSSQASGWGEGEEDPAPQVAGANTSLELGDSSPPITARTTT